MCTHFSYESPRQGFHCIHPLSQMYFAVIEHFTVDPLTLDSCKLLHPENVST